MGVTDITIVTPPESLSAIEAAMSQNPHLTSLPAPKPDIIAPADLTHASGTGELFRLPEVQEAVKGDFIVLPCDIVCELEGTGLWDAWAIDLGGYGAPSGGRNEFGNVPIRTGGEKQGRRGGLGVWYHTKGELSVKGEETDFVATASIPPPAVPPQADSLRPNISNLVYTVPTDTLKDTVEENRGLQVRHSLIRHHARVRMLTTHRDAHIYFFPCWVIEMIKKNPKFESISEDVLGWWAKAGWQDGLGDKLGLRDIFYPAESPAGDMMEGSQLVDEEIDIAGYSSTSRARPNTSATPTALASRVQNSNIPEAVKSLPSKSKLNVPPMYAYVQPPDPAAPLIRRVDTAHLLLSVSLRLAKLPSIEEVGRDAASPFAHAAKIAHKESIPKRCRVESENSLLAENVIVGEKCNIKESVIGSNCKIGEGARLLRCLLMDGVEIGAYAQLTDCILGRRCKVEGGQAKSDDKTVLTKCEVQDGQVVECGSKFILIIHAAVESLCRRHKSQKAV